MAAEVADVILDCGDRTLDLSAPAVMGVLNVTPDSFSDGGEYARVDEAVTHARRMQEDGAAIIDIGGESTRPGAEPVSAHRELRRVLPVVEACREALSIPVSIDTSKPGVMRAAVAAGAGMINDVRALRAPGALATAAACEVPVVLMHMRGQPRRMQRNPRYANVTRAVCAFLRERRAACENAGLAPGRVLLDPGFGFGKTLAHNLELFANLEQVLALGSPVVVGVSRKSMIGALTRRPVAERAAGSVAAAVLAAWKGAALLRVHDVAATVDALAVCRALRGAGPVASAAGRAAMRGQSWPRSGMTGE